MERFFLMKDILIPKLFMQIDNHEIAGSFVQSVLSKQVKINAIQEVSGHLVLDGVLDNRSFCSIHLIHLPEKLYWEETLKKLHLLHQDSSDSINHIVIFLLDFVINDDDSFLSRYSFNEDGLFTQDNDGLIYTIEYPKFQFQEKDLSLPLHQWLTFFHESEYTAELKEVLLKNVYFRDAEIHRLILCSEIEGLDSYYEGRLKQYYDRKNRDSNIHGVSMTIAINMSSDFPPSEIAEIVKIPLEEVYRILS